MEIAKYPETILLTEAYEATDAEISSKAFQKTIDDMIETMEELDAAGLAAPQIFLSKRIVVFRKADGEVVVLINPVIMSRQGRVSNTEYCLSCDGGYKVKRFKRIKVAAKDRNGDIMVINIQNKQSSFCIQHEIDHINGIVIAEKGKAA